MLNKRKQIEPVITVQAANMLEIYNISTPTIHYILHNLFRGLRPIRRKY